VERRDFLVVFCLALVMQYLDYRGALGQWEGWFLDIALRWGPLSSSERQIVTVEIDERAYRELFDSKSPLEPTTVKSLVEKVATAADKAVIGVDILTEGREYAGDDWLKGANIVWAGDARASAPPQSPSFLGWFVSDHDKWSFHLPLVLGTDPRESMKWGSSIYLHDRDLGVRKLTRKFDLAKGSANLQVWALEVANAFRNSHDDHDAHEVLVSYSTLPPLEYKVSDLFSHTCKKGEKGCSVGELMTGGIWGEFEKEFKHYRPIVLIGGTFDSSKDLATPIGSQPPLIVDAYAVQAELAGTYVKDFDPWLKFAFDIPLGLAIVWIVDRFAKHSMRRGMQISFLIAAIIIVVNVFLVRAGILWFSFAGVAFGTMLDQLVGLYIENPKPD
jgi:hypothetical protein